VRYLEQVKLARFRLLVPGHFEAGMVGKVQVGR